MIRGYSPFSGVTLVATYTSGGGGPVVTLLQNGVAVTGISDAASGEKYYKIEVPAGQAKLEIEISGGTGDCDLYVRKGSLPTPTEWDYRPYIIGNEETVSVDNPDAATWFIMLRGYTAYSGVTLVATHLPVSDPVTVLDNGVPVPDISGATGSERFYKITVPAGQDFLNVEISGGTGDCDLYVKKGSKPTTTSWDYRPYLIGNDEIVEIDNPAAATWYIMLQAYSAYSGVTLVATYGPAGNNFAADPNCVALWRFERTPGGNLDPNDSIGTNTLVVDGADSDIARYKEGAGSADFEEHDADYAYIANGDLSDDFPLKNGTANKKISVCMWFRGESFKTQALYAKYDGTVGYSFALFITRSGSKHYVSMRIGHSNGRVQEVRTNTKMELAANQWYHVGATFDDGDRSYRIRVHDATGDVTAAAFGPFDNHVSLVNSPVVVGAYTSMGNPVFPYDGLIDELAVFNDTLTADEIDQIRQGAYGKP
jgi:hypothetical protein